MALKPLVVNLLGTLIGIGAIEQGNTLGKGAVCQKAQQVGLGAARFGEDDRLLFRAYFPGLGKGDVQRLKQGLALGIVFDGDSQRGERIEIGNLLFKGGAVCLGEWLGRFAVAPFLGGFIQGLVILVQFLLQRLCRLLLAELVLKPVGDRGQRAGDGEGR